MLYRRQDPGTPFVIEFVETAIGGEPQPVEHAGVRWVSVTELGALALAPTDQAFAKQLQDES
jgi:8-oxo-dGTP pyrophosphatase MutT (NUDIX family)